MASLSYAFVTSTSAPYQRLLRFVDGIVSHVTEFPGMASGISLASASFTPDNEYLIAASNTSSTTPFRMWRNVSNSFVEITMGSISSTSSFSKIRWMTNTHVIAVGAQGVWFGVLNRSTHSVSWTRTSTTAYDWVAPHPDGLRTICCTTAGALVWFLRTGDTLASTSGSFQGSEGKTFPQWNSTGDIFVVLTPTGQYPVPIRKLVPTNYLTYVGTDVPANEIAANGVARGALLYDRAGIRLLYSVERGNRLGSAPVGNFNINVLGSHQGPDSKTASIPALATTMAFATDTIVLAGVNSTASTGRVRGFNYNYASFDYVEIPEIAAIFSDWSMIATDIAVSNMTNLNANPVDVYNSTLSDLINDDVDLSSLKIALLSTASGFNQSHTTLAQVLGANEVSGSSWPTGGVSTGTATFAIDGSGPDYCLNLDIPAVDMVASGSFSFSAAVIYDNTNVDKKPLVFMTFDTPQTINQFDRVKFNITGNKLIILDAGA